MTHFKRDPEGLRKFLATVLRSHEINLLLNLKFGDIIWDLNKILFNVWYSSWDPRNFNFRDSTAKTVQHEETRVWNRKNGKWVNVHCHRSINSGKAFWYLGETTWDYKNNKQTNKHNKNNSSETATSQVLAEHKWMLIHIFKGL